MEFHTQNRLRWYERWKIIWLQVYFEPEYVSIWKSFLSDEEKDNTIYGGVGNKNRISNCNTEKQHAFQSRMTMKKRGDNNEEQITNWPVRLRMKINDRIAVHHLNDKLDIATILSEQNAGVNEIFLNEGGFGFYRSFYDFDSDIASRINTMSTIYGIIFVNDQVALATSQRFDLKTVTEMSREFDRETNYAVLLLRF